jgi:Fe2+ or Zn2+ uptake regulation protein
MTDVEAQAARLLREAGIRPTPERSVLLRIIGGTPHLDAAEIYQLARERSPRIGLATVYRTLRTLERSGVIEVCGLGQGHSHYEIRRRHHVHLVCVECGKVLDIPSAIDIAKLAQAHGFTVTHSNLELVGVCQDCRRTLQSAEAAPDKAP